MRLAVDTGGTFTDLVVDNGGSVSIYKSPTTPDDPVRGILDVISIAADAHDLHPHEFLGRADILIYATTWAINALLTGNTAVTALLTTQGHRDVLLLREGGREHFNVRAPYPEPYVPRSLTFEIPERISAEGEIVDAMDERAVVEILRSLASRGTEAVAICLLWSIVNPVHELRLGELLETCVPGVPYTLSHQLNPSIREFRRASSTAIDASLKPAMSPFLSELGNQLQASGFDGRLLMVSSGGGLLDVDRIAEAPIHAIKSGPTMAPVAGRYYAKKHGGEMSTVVVVDTGGTSFDVSLVQGGRVPWTRETWLGPRYLGHVTGFPSIDVKSYGAGGGSIAWIDDGGLLHVGPQSAGSVPGPACYGRGGTQPTVTDAALVLGFIDPDDFLGGAMKLRPEAAAEACEVHVARKTGLSTIQSAAAILQLATEHMIRAVQDTAIGHGVDVRSAMMVAGGGAAGLNCVAMARRLGCEKVIIPDVAAVLSAAGALGSDLREHYSTTCRTSTDRFDHAAIADVVTKLSERCAAFAEGIGSISGSVEIQWSVEGHYPSEVYDLEVVLSDVDFTTPEGIEGLRQAFHQAHEDAFAVADSESAVEFVTWHARVTSALGGMGEEPAAATVDTSPPESRSVYFQSVGWVVASIHRSETLAHGDTVVGPAVISSSMTTVALDPGDVLEVMPDGSLVITLRSENEATVDFTGYADNGDASVRYGEDPSGAVSGSEGRCR